MADEELDIYGDYDFSQADDILDDIVKDKPSTTKKRSLSTQIESNDGNNQRPEKETKTRRLDKDEQTPQKIQTVIQTHNHSNEKSLPHSLTQLRGISTKPTHSIYLGELHWYTTDKTVKEALKKDKLLDQVREMTFLEHKINGKSKGIVFFEFNNKESAIQAKNIFDQTELDHKKVYAIYTTASNPFKHLSKESNTNKTTRASIPRMGTTTINQTNFSPAAAAAAAAAATAAMTGFMPPAYGFNRGTAANFMGYNEMPFAAGRDNRSPMPNNALRNSAPNMNYQQQSFNPAFNNRNNQRGNNNMNDGAGFGGMYINPAFFGGNKFNNNKNNGGYGS